MGDDENQFTRFELMKRVLYLSQSMLRQGLKADDFVILPCDRSISFWCELLAIWAIGAKPICIEAEISEEHALSICRMTNVSKIIGAESISTLEFSHLKKIDTHIIDDDSECSVHKLFDAIPFALDTNMPELAGLIFTSGTTGLPKGVPLTHRTLTANALATSQRLRLHPSDRLMIATPFRFISSISHFLVTLISGASFFGLEKTMMAKDLISALNNLEITAFGGSPFHVQFLAMAGQERLPKLRWAMSSGDHLRPAVIEELSTKFDNLELHVVYGMAELGGRFCELPPEASQDKLGSVGFPITGFEYTIRREDKTMCNHQEIGDIYVGGTLAFGGYYNNHDANEKVLQEYGFFNGDKGYIDEDGYLFLAGRSDSVFKRSGLKISTKVINDAMMTFPAIRDVFVGNMQNDIEGQVPVAYISWEREELPKSDLISGLRNLIAVNHIPYQFITVSEIPRTGSGKVDRRKLNKIIESSQ